jgi:hypothetical protein
MSKGGQMSNKNWNNQTANPMGGDKTGIKFGRGQINIPAPVEAAAITTKGIAPAKGKAQDITVEKGKVSGTMQSMGAAKKGGDYTWS